MAMRKFGAPATSHVRHITAEDAEIINTALESQQEEAQKNEHEEEDTDGE